LETVLSKMKENQQATILRLEGGKSFQRKLRTIGIREGKLINILTKQPLGGPVVVEIDGRSTTIGRGMAGRIIVEL